MKVALASDIHLEFGPIKLENTENADVLILSGDICTASVLEIPVSLKGMTMMEFFENVSKEFPHTVYVMGNHEHYDYDFAYTGKVLKDLLRNFGNIHVLDKEIFGTGDYVFVGGTLWTNMNDNDEITHRIVGRSMNDFRIVKNSNRMVSYKDITYAKDPVNPDRLLRDTGGNLITEKVEFKERVSTFCTQDAYDDHLAMMKFLTETIETTPIDKKIIVVGHHAPSKLSTHPRYRHEKQMNGGYSSDLNDFILKNPQIKLWTHGHTHESFDYMIGTTRVACNPRGYINYEPRADHFKLQYIEV